jgi:hypothetical protein
MTEIDLRPLPGTTSVCQLCKRTIVWATTVAGPNGPGGKSQPFDPVEDPKGNVALFPRGQGRLLARALQHGEDADRPLEYLGMPHAATCARAPVTAGAPAPDMGNVVDFAAARRRRGARR